MKTIPRVGDEVDVNITSKGFISLVHVFQNGLVYTVTDTEDGSVILNCWDKDGHKVPPKEVWLKSEGEGSIAHGRFIEETPTSLYLRHASATEPEK